MVKMMEEHKEPFEKFWAEVKKVFPKIDFVGVKIEY